MVAPFLRSRIVTFGLPSLLAHALIVTGLYSTPEPEPDCPSRKERCDAFCEKRELSVPRGCTVDPRPCICEAVPVELATPELLAFVEPPPPEPEPTPPGPPEPEPPPAAEVPTAASVKEPSARNASRRAEKAARSVRLAKVLGTYGGPEGGSVFDVIESEENTLDELFAEGVGSADRAKGGEALAGGGEGVVRPSKTPPLRAAVLEKMPSLRRCQTAATIEAGAAGKLVLTVTVDDDGKPSQVDVRADTTGSTTLRDCVVERVEGWRLPAGEAGDVEFSVVFSLD